MRKAISFSANFPKTSQLRRKKRATSLQKKDRWIRRRQETLILTPLMARKSGD
jgi:hypothetical protein